VVHIPIPLVHHDPATHLAGVRPNKLRVMPGNGSSNAATVFSNSSWVKVDDFIIPSASSTQPVLQVPTKETPSNVLASTPSRCWTPIPSTSWLMETRIHLVLLKDTVALIRPSLSNSRQLIAPHKSLHIRCSWLNSLLPSGDSCS